MRAKQQRGFTLVELLVAIAISGIVFLMVFGVIRSAVNTQVYVREMSDAGRQGPAILQQISADLENAYFYNALQNDVFIGKMMEIGGDLRADRVHLVTTRPSLLMDPDIEPVDEYDQGHPSLVSEVSWVLKEARNGNYYELHRREQPGFDDEFTRGGYYRMITDRVISFKLQYTGWDLSEEGGSLASSFGAGEEAGASSGLGGLTGEGDEGATGNDEDATLEWEDEWNSIDKGCLPVAVKIEMIISPLIDPDVEDRIRKEEREDEFEYHYIHIVLLPQFREDIQNMQATYQWEGAVAEPVAAGGVAGGAGGRGGGRDGQGGQDGRGGKDGQGQNNPQTSSPFMDIIRGGGNRGGGNNGGGGLGNILGGGANRGGGGGGGSDR